jgi:hypothetical protein
MRTPGAVLLGIVLLSAWTYPEQTQLPTLAADTVTIKEVHSASAIGADGALRDPSDALLVERPVDAREGARASVFVVDTNRELLRRVAVEYGRASPSLIQIVSGVSRGDRIVVSDMREWDAFERLRLRSR